MYTNEDARWDAEQTGRRREPALCDECDRPGTTDLGYTYLCDACAAEATADAGPSDAWLRSEERKQMGLGQ